jgi:hypothetical protein
MKITELKNLMKEINEPNEFILQYNPTFLKLYWVFIGRGIRLKTLQFGLDNIRKEKARFTVFLNGVFISPIDYELEQKNNDIYIKFIKNNFPLIDGLGRPYTLNGSDEVKIKGDLEII